MKEVTDFLRPWDGEVAASAFPFCSIYFNSQQLLIHCISMDNSLRYVPAAAFLELTQQQAFNGVKVIHLWEDVWRTKTAIVQSRLRAAFGQSQRIPARLTRVSRIDKPTLDAFLEKNHLQVTTKAKYKYGLFLPERYFRVLDENGNRFRPFLQADNTLLVAVASFSGGKNILREGVNHRSFELIRFANLLNCTVVGGLDKLLKAFIKELKPDDIMTYADRDWSDGRSYERLGFERVEATAPQLFWLNPMTGERLSAERLNQEAILDTWIRICNSGSWKYLKTLKQDS